ncbi:MAG: class I SAM-dependent RNA methyltransferase [Sandaracinaceae bacterium]
MSDELEGTVRDLSRFGDAVVKTEKGLVFARGALPGERVKLGGVRKQGKVLRAERVQVVDASTQRVDPVCPIVGRCGGCPLMIGSPPLQAQYRRGLLSAAVAGLPGAEEAPLRWRGTKQTMGYRMRARIRWENRGKGLRYGFRGARSDRVADIRSCAVLHPTLDIAQAAIRRTVGAHLAGSGEVHLAMGEGGFAVAALRSEDAQPPELYTAAAGLVSDGPLSGLALRVGGATTDVVHGDPREFRAARDGEPLVGTVAGFSQAHDEVNRALVDTVVELAAPADRHVLELFAGAGNLTVALAPDTKSMVAVELDEHAAAACRENLRRRDLTVTVRTDDAETFRAKERPDVVVLDPPRAGAPMAVKKIAKLAVPTVVYVSCDPPTLRRDLSFLAEAGYRITDVVGLDMFPQTAHLESVVRLQAT